MKIGITGHQELPNEELWDWVRITIVALLAQESNKIVGYTSLAKGADQLFADVVLEYGGGIYAVIPFPGYERTLRGQERHHFKELLERASKETLNVDGSDEDAYLAAGRRIV